MNLPFPTDKFFDEVLTIFFPLFFQRSRKQKELKKLKEWKKLKELKTIEKAEKGERDENQLKKPWKRCHKIPEIIYLYIADDFRTIF